MTVVKTFRSDVTNRDAWRIVQRWVLADSDIVKGDDLQYGVEEYGSKISGWRSDIGDKGYVSVEEAEKEVRKRSLVQAAEACDGMEVHRDDWNVIRELLAEKRIAAIGPPRGPDMAWKRIEPLPGNE